MSQRKVRVAVADPSSVNIRIVRQELVGLPGAELSGTAKDSAELMEVCRSTRPELLTLDLELALGEGFLLLEQVIAEFPELVVVITASAAERGLAVRGLSRGAFEIVDLNAGKEDHGILRNALINGIKEVERRNGVDSSLNRVVSDEEPPIRIVASESCFDLVLVACSTGGPNALRQVVPSLPGDFPIPVLAVQHLPQGYLPDMVKQLNGLSAIDVSIATHRMDLPQKGWVFARPGWHLEIRPNLLTGKGYYLKETNGAPKHGCRPAADVLFDSVAKWFDGRVLSIVMTGMGRDGCAGVANLKRSRQVHCLIQDTDTSVVYGMPRAVEEAGLADEVLPLERVADRVSALVSGSAQ